MAQLSEANVCNRWLEECGRIDPIYPDGDGRNLVVWRGNRKHEYTRWRVLINEDGHLVHRNRGRTTELARFVGERRLIKQRGGCLLLNGNGFNGELSAIQERLRNRAREVFRIRDILIIPHLALTGAQIEFDTITPISVSSDTWTVNRVPVKIPPRTEWPTVTRDFDSKTFSWGGRSWRVTRARRWRRTSVVQVNELAVLHQPPNGQSTYHDIQGTGNERWIHERVHNLGSSVFSAVGPDGEHHRYISAFDAQERTPMYFLAQLPDEGICNSYMDALNLLAPPIVHEARKAGKRVFRQGDIFAIETEMTLRQFRREEAKFVERGDVFDGEALRVPRRSVLRRRAMIYGTGHTATWVAVKPNGTTFIRGTMYHDPVLERAGRTREHRNVILGKGDKWFLCCRNTVPRATTTTPREEENNDTSNTHSAGALDENV